MNPSTENETARKKKKKERKNKKTDVPRAYN